MLSAIYLVLTFTRPTRRRDKQHVRPRLGELKVHAKAGDRLVAAQSPSRRGDQPFRGLGKTALADEWIVQNTRLNTHNPHRTVSTKRHANHPFPRRQPTRHLSLSRLRQPTDRPTDRRHVISRQVTLRHRFLFLAVLSFLLLLLVRFVYVFFSRGVLGPTPAPVAPEALPPPPPPPAAFRLASSSFWRLLVAGDVTEPREKSRSSSSTPFARLLVPSPAEGRRRARENERDLGL